MRKLFIPLALSIALYASPAHANLNEQVTCSGWSISTFETGASLTVKADNVIVYDGIVDPYLTLSLPWPKAKNNHRLVVTLDGERSTFQAKRCS